MVSSGSLPAKEGNVFDFSSQTGMMHVLASIRASEISVSERSELRDLVLLYMNGGQDESVRITLEKRLTGYGVIPIARKSEKKTPELPRPTIGTFRTTPTFTLRTTPPTITVEQPKVSIPPAWSATKAPIPAEATISIPGEEVNLNSIPVVTHSAPEETLLERTVEQVPPAKSDTPFIPTQEATPISAIKESQTEPAPSSEAVDALARIREIKASVNEKVGNPVNLVDIDNVVGREYMAALLDAMKTLNTGSSVTPALQRLEDSYASVLRTLEAHKEGGQTQIASAATILPTPQVAAPTVQPKEPAPQPTPSEPIRIAAPEVTNNPGSSVSVVTPDVAQAAPPISNQQQSATGTPNGTLPVTTYEDPIRATPITQTTPPQATVSARSIPVSRYSEPATPPTPVIPSPPPTPAPNPPSVQKSSSNFSSLADLKDVGIPSKEEALRNSQSKEVTKAVTDTLFASEVTEGLSMLLSEWSIFKKSGLFGTGPKGIEHPLFLKMAPLQIPLILAGRFEGATQEIKQSVTDYMNGWRYEQSIIYEQGETFEHYLRRVVRHIIDMQKR